MRVDPVRAVLQDDALRRRLAEARVASAFERWIEDTVPPVHPDAPEIRAEILAKAVEAFAGCPDEDAAFMRYRALGMYAKGGALDAFEDLYRMVDADLAGVIGQRSVAIGYPGPLAEPRLMRCGCLGLSPATYLVVPMPEMVAQGASAGVELQDGKPFRELDGTLIWTRLRWHWMKGDAAGEIPGGLVDEVVATVRRPPPEPSAQERIISGILADLIDDDGKEEPPRLGEFDALCVPDEAAVLVTQSRLSLERLGARLAARDRAGAAREVGTLRTMVALLDAQVAPATDRAEAVEGEVP